MKSVENTSFVPTVWPEPLTLRCVQQKPRQQSLGEILIKSGEISAADLIKATAILAREDVNLPDILLANHMVSETGLLNGFAQLYACELVNLNADPADIRLVETAPPSYLVRHNIIPWKRIGAVTLIATSRPDVFKEVVANLPSNPGPTMMVIARESEITAALQYLCGKSLALSAETRVAPQDSCREWNTAFAAKLATATALVLSAALYAAPQAIFGFFTILAITALVFNTALKAAAAHSNFRSAQIPSSQFSSSRGQKTMMRLPKVSLLVPLFEEREIAAHLVRRLENLNYPRELLDVFLILEQDDLVTQSELRAAKLPAWMHQIIVPDSILKTKPRALNYSMNFCKGSVIGVYDAEDLPEADQLLKVVRHFHECDPKVACLQGVLDFYNTSNNWLSRCFTIEYATWFRVVLPGLERLGFVIPLGGTTIFFRREILEKIGCWDAHNVTEDADLGIRLARHGYRTELIATKTEEEANCRLWPWVRQRSRWLKGYAITWAVHMRSPRKLLADLGAWKFFGVQLLFLGALSQFFLAPLLWSFWAIPLGLPHPLEATMSPTALYLLATLFFASEALSFTINFYALAPKKHRRLWLWIPTLHFYYPLATFAAYKGIWELFSKPFYWDKTAHGQSEKN